MLYFLVILGLIFIAYSYLSSRSEPEGSFENISTKDAKRIMNEKDNISLIDVRTTKEVSRGSIPGSIHINVMSPGFNEAINTLDPKKTYIVYCVSGQRSRMACRKMHKAGFRSLYNLSEGYASW